MKVILSTRLPAELVERLRNAVYWTPGLSVEAVVTEAVARAVERLERARGGEFPPRPQALRRGVRSKP